jgi:hypothetical protein
MRTLKSAIATVLPDYTNLGEGGRTLDRERLIKLLDGLSSDLTRAYWIRLAVGFAVFVFLLVLTARMANQPTVLASLMVGMGITVGGAIAALKQVTDEMARVRLLLAIAPELTLEALTEIASKIANSL